VLKQRVITAVVLLAIVLGAAAIGRLALDAVLAILLGAAAFEWLRLAQHSALVCLVAACAFAAVMLALQAFVDFPADAVAGALTAVACVAWLLIAAIIVRGAHRGARVPHAVSTLLALVLLAAAWVGLMRLLDAGFAYLISMLAIVWLADIAAYFAGRRWGKRKLAPAISPGKTWAGVGGAVVATLAAAFLLARLAPDVPLFSTLLQQKLAPAAALVLLAALVALSIVGDLFESLLKRQAGVKDSGILLPGHGGVFDRTDAAIAVLPAAALLDLWLRG
jgi:phosphatidate cytidylyltransferase